MSVHVHRSNRLEALIDALVEVWDAPASSPIAPEVLVTPSRGMASWVRLAVAENAGIAARIDRWTPGALVDRILDAWQGAEADVRWGRDQLPWVLLDELPAHLDDPVFAPLADWLAAAGDTPSRAMARRWQLARRVAHLFDQYATYRPHRVRAWSAGDDDVDDADRWQPALWRALEARLGRGHVAARCEAVAAGPPASPGDLPERVVLFGVTSLPPLHLDLVAQLGEHADVHLMHLAPTPEWWADLRTPREQHRIMAAHPPGWGEPVARALHLDEGHPLLASLGRLGRELQDLVERHLGDHEAHDHFVPPAPAHLLGAVQRDLYEVRAPAADVAIDVHDVSVQVHGCHSPAREVEVLRDRLLALLADDPTLRPRDIVVLTPDIAVHGPLVDAVFGVAPDHPAHLPYTIADRPLAEGHEVARALLAVLDRVGTRLAVPEVVELLAHPPIRERFELTEAGVERLGALVAEVGVRWGADRAHRASIGQPDVDAHTWHAGLSRLVLGHAMAGDTPWEGVVPFADAEGDAAALAAVVSDVWSRLSQTLAVLASPASPAAWVARLEAALEALVDVEGHAEQVQQVREQLRRIAQHAAEAGFDDEVPLPVLRDLLERHLVEERRVGGFLRAGITFCELLPMRAIPFRVVALLGLSDGLFPRPDTALGFDLVARQRAQGDRARRDDDRQLVLDALLSARDALVVTYVSHSVQDNEPLPPSVVLADVIDALEATATVPEPHAVRERLVVHHPLQPFGEGYVDGSDPFGRLITFDDQAQVAARARREDPEPPRAFLAARLEVDDLPDVLDLDGLVQFYGDPLGWFVEKRLQIGRPEELEALPDREPIELDHLEQWGVGDRLLALRREGVDWQTCREILSAEGRVPLGELAKPYLSEASRRVDGILKRAKPFLERDALPPQLVDVEVEGVRLVGRLDDLREDGRVVLTYGNLASGPGRQRLRAWIPHLLLQLADLPETSRRTRWFGRDGEKTGDVLTLAPTSRDQALATLGTLVRIWRDGHAAPIVFHPDAGWAWSAAVASGASARAAYKARTALKGALELRASMFATWSRVLGTPDAYATAAAAVGTVTLGDGDAVPSLGEVADAVFGPYFVQQGGA